MKKLLTRTLVSVLCMNGFTAFAQTQTFNYTGTLQNFTIPACVNSITIEAYGAQGGTASYGPPPPGGLGAYIKGTFSVSPGQVLNIMVGQMGLMGTGGCGDLNGGGGGGSFVWDPTNTTNPWIAAGGGGGSGSCGQGVGQPGQSTLGGTGLGGNCGNCNNGNGTGGGGAGWGGDGMGCKSNAGCGASPPAITPLGGGTGGTPYIGDCYQNGFGGYGGGGAGGGNCGGAGGGGGYTGGNAGGNAILCPGDNAIGGTSYNVGTSQTNTAGVRTGNGMVVITYTVGVPSAAGPITGSGSVCAGSTSTYSIATVSGATSYAWTVPSGAVINSGQGTTSISVTFGSTSGTISVTPSNSCGSGAAANLNVTVNALPVVALGNDVTQCGGTVLLDAGNVGSTYLWSDNSTTQTITVSASGTYSVVVTNVNGCTGTDAINVTINTAPVVSLGNDITQCGGTAMLDAGNVGATYLWSDNSTTQMITVSASGTYSVVVTAVNGCTGTDAINVTINAIPNVTLALNPTTVCITIPSYVLTGGNPSGGTYSGTGVSGGNFDPSVAGLGTFTITYDYTDPNTGCNASANQSITVDACTGISGTGILSQLSIYPNPANGQLYIVVPSAVSEMRMQICDMQGKTVYNGSVNELKGGDVFELNIASFSNGIYSIRLFTESDMTVKKLVIQH